MIHLRMLGGAVLERDGTPLGGRPAQSHHLALLAFLSVAPGQTASRDRLIGFLWPESETTRARHRLSVALHVLRQGLGGDLLVTVGDAVTLSGAAIRTDAGAFLEAISEGRAEDAVAMYGGPFLDGFFLSGTPDFERWVDGEQDRLEGMYRSALERLASEAEKTGDLRSAIEWRRRLVSLAPYEASRAVSLMRALAAIGDLAGALAYARAHIARVEGELGIPASPKVLEFLDELSEAVRRRREEEVRDVGPLVARVERAEELAPATTSGAPRPSGPLGGAGSTPPRRGGARPLRRIAPWMAVAPAMLGAVVLWNVIRGGGAEVLEPDPSVAILPFDVVAADASAPLVGAGIVEAIRATLEVVPNLRVSETPPAAASTRDPVRLGGELRVAHVVTGLVEMAGPEGSPVRATVRLTNVRSGELEWEGRYERPRARDDVLIELLSMFIADDLRLRVAPFIPHHYTSSEVANDEFLAGVFEHRKLTEESLWVAIQHYRRATERDPTFALAWAVQGGAYMSLTGLGLTPEVGFEQARMLIGRALELDPRLPEGYANLARLQLYWDRDFPNAEQSIRRAITLYPTHPDSREWRAWYLLYYRGEADAAVASSRRALELDPLNTARSRALERILFMARRFEEIPAQSRHTWSLGPDVAAALQGPFLADAYREMGRYDDAIREYLLDQERRGGRTRFGLAITYARMGRDEDARAILREWEADLNPRYRRIAQMHAALGNVDEALGWLERAFEATPSAILDLKVNVDYDPLRPDPRFGDLVRRMGLND